MGMFDYVKFEADCPVCGDPITEWQTKQGRCLMETISPLQARKFHSICPTCDSMVDVELELPSWWIHCDVASLATLDKYGERMGVFEGKECGYSVSAPEIVEDALKLIDIERALTMQFRRPKDDSP